MRKLNQNKDLNEIRKQATDTRQHSRSRPSGRDRLPCSKNGIEDNVARAAGKRVKY